MKTKTKQKQTRPTKRLTVRAQAPPIPTDDAVRLGALRMLSTLALEMDDPPLGPFHLRGVAAFGDECLDSPAETFARLVANGQTYTSIMAALGVDVPVLVAGLIDLCRGARVEWQPRKAVA